MFDEGTTRKSTGGGAKSPKKKGAWLRWLLRLVAAVIGAGSLAVAPALVAGAAVGGGGTGGGGGGGNASSDYWLYTLDHNLAPTGSTIVPEQGWGQASIDYFNAAMTAQGQWANSGPLDGTPSGLNAACTAAINQAIARSNGAATQARVVQVGVSVGSSGGTTFLGWGGTYQTMLDWYNGLTSQNYWQPDIRTTTDPAALQAIHDNFTVNIAQTTPRIVCVALNNLEPAPPGYALSVTTDKANAFTIAGGTNPVKDTIHADNGGSAIRENVSANVILHFEAADGTTKTVTKAVSIVNQGDTVSPDFTPGDLGMTSWDGGTYWFDVQVGQQGKMLNTVDAPDKDPRETWTAWKPQPNKQVDGSAEQSGDLAHADINGLTVYPGQKLEYSVGVDLRVPAGVDPATISSLVVKDAYDSQFTPDKSSVEFWDSRTPSNPQPIGRSNYTLAWDPATNSFTATFTDAWVKANIQDLGTPGWLTMRFTGTVKTTTAPGATVQNQAFQIVNGVSNATEIPVVKVPSVTPHKEDLNTDLQNIDGKTVLTGDHLLYRLTLDSGPARNQLAYDLHKLGMFDNFDSTYLDLKTAGVHVINQATGADVTAQFNIQIQDTGNGRSTLYAFAKQVDSTNPNGDAIPGDPQPTDLKVYDAAAIDPLNSPIIDQSLLGSKYWITMDTTVKKSTDGYTIRNQAVENIENTRLSTEIVSNPLKDINPSKDVVVSEQTGGTSINQTVLPLHQVFNYRLNTSTIPADRAYGAKDWSLTDTFDRMHDQYTGTWAIYADQDLYNGQTLLVAKGALLQDSAGHESEALRGLFTVTFDPASYTLKVVPTQKYLDLVNSRGDLPAGYSVYTQMIRIAPAAKVDNQTTETYNSVDRVSNIVWTSTPAPAPAAVVGAKVNTGGLASSTSPVDERALVLLTIAVLLTGIVGSGAGMSVIARRRHTMRS